MVMTYVGLSWLSQETETRYTYKMPAVVSDTQEVLMSGHFISVIFDLLVTAVVVGTIYGRCGFGLIHRRA